MKVSTRLLRSLASIVKPSILTGAITESADYIDELESINVELKNEIQTVLDSPLTDWVEIHDDIQDILKKY